jgi:hypothetical protein
MADQPYRTIAKAFCIRSSATALQVSMTPPSDKRAQRGEYSFTYKDRNEKRFLFAM